MQNKIQLKRIFYLRYIISAALAIPTKAKIRDVRSMAANNDNQPPILEPTKICGPKYNQFKMKSIIVI